MKRRVLSLVPVVIATVLMAGCASSDDALDQATAATLQSGVAQVAQHASAGDTTGALTSLDQLQASLDAAEAAGTIAADRAQLVQQNIDVVRADLQPAGETAPETTAPTDTDPATTVETPPAEETPTPPADDSGGKGPGGDNPNKGPGNNSGNGNGGGPGKK